MSVSLMACAVFVGNAMTAAFLWSCVQFHKHDTRAPWPAYAGFLMPLLMGIGALYLTGERLPFLGALAAQ